MIKFFRHIRQNLVMENKTSKYFKYAIGEILLVVVGILIALQINNWNENRKERSLESASLLGIKAELQHTLKELNNDLEDMDRSYKATKDVLQYINEKPVVNDSMYVDFYDMTTFNYFFPKTSNYETLKSGGLNNIQSDSIRLLITEIYEAGYNRILFKQTTRRNGATLLFPYYQKHFRTTLGINTHQDAKPFSKRPIGVPTDYDHLINDAEFETLIIEAVAGRRNFLRDYETTVALVEDCIGLIDSYLNDETN
ncbi:DUF6090 family protein [Winogradskyella alexanderae]|uniref:Uncharacterized protein n=1 Tax=Winogradskyella alexanderae TaxID=2877123 RepID=A0ABS7XUW8_9FLAO|nr:DUF6090 family protein [Winogradskyella alexanderae]MCA0133812.1 hypothetical protein [Winogradskyella alexanderae]